MLNTEKPKKKVEENAEVERSEPTIPSPVKMKQ